MAVAIWPEALPKAFSMDSFEEADGDGLIRTQPDMGPANVRRRSSAMPRLLNGTMRMTTAQLATVRLFAHETLMDRAMPFLFHDQVGGGLVLVRMVSPLAWKRAATARFDVTLSLEVLP